MARAVLQLVGDSTSILAALDALLGHTRTVAQAMRGEFQAAFRATSRSADAMRAHVAKAYAAAASAERKAADEAKRQEQRRTDAVEAESGYRTSARKKEADEATRQDQRVTSSAEREARKRKTIAQRAAREAGQLAGRAASGAVSFGGAAHGMIQDTRRGAAGAERQLGSAVYQAGGDRAEVQRRLDAVRAASIRTGLSVEDIAAAANAAQTEFSSLSGANAAERSSRFNTFLETMDFASRTGNNAGETARLQGMLSQSGFDDDTQRTTMRFAAGAAQQGAIELGGLTREGLSSIMRRMADASGSLGPNATAQQRQGAMAAAFRQQVAAMEVFRGQGSSARAAGNALAGMQEALRSPARTDKILNNIEGAAQSTTDPARRARLNALRAELFEADPTRRGQRRLREQFRDPLQFQAALARQMGNDPTAISGLLAGGGFGNPQSLLQNQRMLLGMLSATDAEGKTAAQRVGALQTATLSEEDVRRGAGIFQDDTQAQLNREETNRQKALLENSGELSRLSNAFSEWASRNPILSAALPVVAGAAVPGLLGRAVGWAGGLLGFGGGAAAGGAGAAGAGGAFSGLAGGALAIAGAKVLAAGAAGAAVGEGVNRAGARAIGQRADLTAETSIFSKSAWQEIGRSIAEAVGVEVRWGLKDANVSVRPQDAAHAARVALQGQPGNGAR